MYCSWVKRSGGVASERGIIRRTVCTRNECVNDTVNKVDAYTFRFTHIGVNLVEDHRRV